MDDDTRGRFRERIRPLIARESEGLRAGTEIRRGDVEEIGASLGMGPEQACLEFLSMKGVAWEFASGGSFTTHTGHSDEDERYPRNWSELMNVVLVYGDDRKC